MSKKEFNPEEWIDTPQTTSNAAASPRPLPDAGSFMALKTLLTG